MIERFSSRDVGASKDDRPHVGEDDGLGQEQGELPAQNSPIEPRSSSTRARELALGGIWIVALGAAIYHGRPFLAPLAAAILLKFLLAPVVRGAKRLGIPNPAGAFLAIAAVVGILGAAVYWLSEPMSVWLARAPHSVAELERAAEAWQPEIETLSRATDTVDQVGQGDDSDVVDVRISDEPAIERAIGWTWPAVANLLVVLILLYFLLAGGDLFVAKLVESTPRMRDKKAAVTLMRSIERRISGYLSRITLINLTLGVAVGLVCFLAGLPNPTLWGAMAALFNFVPFLGALAGVAVVGMVSLATHGPITAALFAPAVYLLLTGLEGYLITPVILGRAFSLSPVAVVCSMLFWGWAWGLFGLLIAVPLLMVAKIALERSERTATAARFLAGA